MVKFKKVAVLMGGVSSERNVSIRSGEGIVRGLVEAGCDAVGVVLDNESIEGKIPKGTEAVYIALHGGYGENGGVQADLQKLGIPYTGSGPKASRIAMDKVLTKTEFVKAGVPTPKYEVLELSDTKTNLSFPVVVKPPCDGSSVGLTCPCHPKDWERALETARKIDNKVLVEEYIPGREWTATVIADGALPIIEITPNSGVYDYASKYTSGATVYTVLNDTSETRACQELAIKACRAIGVQGLARVDFRVTPDNRFYALEINTVPGFTATSLAPKAAAKAGFSFSDICVKVLNLASADKE